MRNSQDKETQAFITLLKAGLWEKDVSLSQYEKIDFKKVYQLAEEQSVVGLIAAGLEHVVDVKVPKEDILFFVGAALQLEQRNAAMNRFIGVLINILQTEGIFTTLIKGQGIAQCYDRPLWRACGDIDFFFDAENYERAKSSLLPIAESVAGESPEFKHLGLSINQWVVELHGTLRSGSLPRMDRVIDAIQDETFKEKRMRFWHNERTDVYIPDENNDVIFVFTHIIKHFFHEGIGLRQICDWCRLLWTYRDTIDRTLLESRLIDMHLMSEWKAFAYFAVYRLGMPPETIPFYDEEIKWQVKSERLESFIFSTGNFGHNRDYSYYGKCPFVIRKAISFWRRTCDGIRQFFIFPLDSVCVWWNGLFNGFFWALRGK